jgi:hypothetical protein
MKMIASLHKESDDDYDLVFDDGVAVDDDDDDDDAVAVVVVVVVVLGLAGCCP